MHVAWEYLKHNKFCKDFLTESYFLYLSWSSAVSGSDLKLEYLVFSCKVYVKVYLKAVIVNVPCLYLNEGETTKALESYLSDSLPSVYQENAISWFASFSLSFVWGWLLSAVIWCELSAHIKTHLDRLQSSGRISVRTGHYWLV